MERKGNKKYITRFKRFHFILSCCVTSSLLTTSFALPIKALIPLQSSQITIAKLPDEREPEAVSKTIQQVDTAQQTSQPPVRDTKERIESPLAPKTTPTNTASTSNQPSNTNQQTATRQTQPSNTNQQTATRQTQPNNTNQQTATRQTQPNNTNQQTASRQTQPNNTNQQTASRQTQQFGRRQPTHQTTAVYSSRTPNYREINFVDFAFGILAPDDYQSQGRYFHFYQFEGRENQLVQIRLTGSEDSRRTNNLKLDPHMFLLDPNNNVIVSRGSQGTSKDAFVFARLPVAGTYTIAVTSQNPKDTGRYSLALRNDRASYILDESSAVEEGLTLKRSGNPYDISKFQGKKEQLVSIRVDSVYEEFSPYILLLNSQGQVIASDNDKDGRYSALIDRARLPADDTYYVVVISSIPQERGAYRLTIF